MGDKLKELRTIVAFVGSIVGGFFLFMEKSGASDWLAASYGEPLKILAWSAGILASAAFGAALAYNFELAGGGAEPAGEVRCAKNSADCAPTSPPIATPRSLR